MANSDELVLDIEELKKLRSIGKRPRVVELISSEILNLEKNIVEEEQVPRRSLRGHGRGNCKGKEQLRQEMVEPEPQPQRPIQNQQPQRNPLPSLPSCELIELFWKQNPPKFTSHGDPLDVEEWVDEIEKIFELLHYTDRERISCLSFQLAKSADFWWRSKMKSMTLEELENFTWEEFKKGLYGRYIPETYWIEKEMEFYALRQGTMTVTEYDNLFCSLSRYAPHVDTDAKMAAKFRYGLKPEIHARLAIVGPLSCCESFNRALEIEAIYAGDTVTTIDSASNPQGQHQKRKRKKNFRNSSHNLGGQGRKWQGYAPIIQEYGYDND